MIMGLIIVLIIKISFLLAHFKKKISVKGRNGGKSKFRFVCFSFNVIALKSVCKIYLRLVKIFAMVLIRLISIFYLAV